MSKETRFFVNTLENAPEITAENFQTVALDMLQTCISSVSKKRRISGPSIYTGTSGIALMYYRIGQLLDTHEQCAKEFHLTAAECWERALDLVSQALQGFHTSRTITFLEGKAGALAVKAVVEKKLMRDPAISDATKAQLLELSTVARNLPTDECELLYGRAGYLSALHFVRRELQDHQFASKEATLILRQIVRHGLDTARANPQWKLSLLYTWHDQVTTQYLTLLKIFVSDEIKKLYLGAAHGIIGILHILVEFFDEFTNLDDDLLDYKYTSPGELINVVVSEILQHYTTASGYVETSCTLTRKRRDALVHWCHGSPGMLPLLSLVIMRVPHSQAQHEMYLNTLHTLALAVWEKVRSMPRHFWSSSFHFMDAQETTLVSALGNAVALLHVASVVDNQLWIRRARKYLIFSIDHLRDLDRIPDRPDSLFEGLAGFAWAICDSLTPSSTTFPGM